MENVKTNLSYSKEMREKIIYLCKKNIMYTNFKPEKNQKLYESPTTLRLKSSVKDTI